MSCWTVAARFGVAQSIELSRRIEALGAISMHASSGGVSPAQKIAAGPAYQIEVDGQIKTQVAAPPQYRRSTPHGVRDLFKDAVFEIP